MEFLKMSRRRRRKYIYLNFLALIYSNCHIIYLIFISILYIPGYEEKVSV